MGRKKKENLESTVKSNVDTVCVAFNSVHGQRFPMPDGRMVEINGNALDLRGKESGVLPVGVYGMTTIAKSDWEYILANYGKMKIFTNGLCFAADSMKDAEKEAENREDLRNGFEPIDVTTTRTQELKGGI